MKRNYAILMASLFMAGACCSCSEKEEVTAAGDNYIQFTMGGSDSRVVPAANDKYQLLWEKGDSVCVFSDHASTDADLYYANYAVVPNTDDARKGKLAFNKLGLRWNEQRIKHQFYAVYPDTSVVEIVDRTSGKVKFHNIVGYSLYKNDEGVYVPKEQVNRMVAYSEYNHVNDTVELKFMPLSTTLDVTITNVGKKNMLNSTYSFMVEDVPYYESETGSDRYFTYDISQKKIIGDHRDIWEGFYNSPDFKNLAPGESVRLRVSLPPVDLGTTHELSVGTGYTNIKYQELDVKCNAGALVTVKVNVTNENQTW